MLEKLIVEKLDYFSADRAFAITASDPILYALVVIHVILMALKLNYIFILSKLADTNDTCQI